MVYIRLTSCKGQPPGDQSFRRFLSRKMNYFGILGLLSLLIATQTESSPRLPDQVDNFIENGMCISRYQIALYQSFYKVTFLIQIQIVAVKRLNSKSFWMRQLMRHWRTLTNWWTKWSTSMISEPMTLKSSQKWRKYWLKKSIWPWETCNPDYPDFINHPFLSCGFWKLKYCR